MKFYRDLFEASLNRVVPERDKQRFFRPSTAPLSICHRKPSSTSPNAPARQASR